LSGVWRVKVRLPAKVLHEKIDKAAYFGGQELPAGEHSKK